LISPLIGENEHKVNYIKNTTNGSLSKKPKNGLKLFDKFTWEIWLGNPVKDQST